MINILVQLTMNTRGSIIVGHIPFKFHKNVTDHKFMRVSANCLLAGIHFKPGFLFCLFFCLSPVKSRRYFRPLLLVLDYISTTHLLVKNKIK